MHQSLQPALDALDTSMAIVADEKEALTMATTDLADGVNQTISAYRAAIASGTFTSAWLDKVLAA